MWIGRGLCRSLMTVSGVVVTWPVRMAVILAFDHPDRQGDGQPGEEGGRENAPVVGVEMEFG